jgi:hypothetical protein
MATKTNAAAIIAALELGENSNRAAVISVLASKLGTPVSRAAVCKKIYGEANPDSARKLAFVFLGLADKAARTGKKIQIKKEVIEGEIHFTLNAR